MIQDSYKKLQPLLYIRFIFFFNDTATTEIYTPLYTLSLHDALPICDEWTAGRVRAGTRPRSAPRRSEEHTSELQSHSGISYAVFCLKKKTIKKNKPASALALTKKDLHFIRRDK